MVQFRTVVLDLEDQAHGPFLTATVFSSFFLGQPEVWVSGAKKYVVRLSAEEREQLDTMIHVGKHPARKLLKARILLKADASEAGEG